MTELRNLLMSLLLFYQWEYSWCFKRLFKGYLIIKWTTFLAYMPVSNPNTIPLLQYEIATGNPQMNYFMWFLWSFICVWIEMCSFLSCKLRQVCYESIIQTELETRCRIRFALVKEEHRSSGGAVITCKDRGEWRL